MVICDALKNIDFALSNGYPTDVNETQRTFMYSSITANNETRLFNIMMSNKPRPFWDMGVAVAEA